MVRLLIAFTVAYCAFLVFLVLEQRSFMYFPFSQERPDIAKAPFMQWIDVTTVDGLALRGWYAPAQKDKPVIILFHGNGHNIEMRLPKAGPLAGEGYGVLLAEYRGYGGNPGDPGEEGLYSDGRAYIDWLIKEQGVTPDKLVIYGESIGSGVAVQMASEYEAKALILDVPFSSALDVAQSQFFFVPFLSLLMKDQYRSDLKIGGIHTPLLVGLAADDMVIPARFGKKLFAAANEPKTLKIYENAVHMDIFDRGFGADVVVFLEALEE